MTLADTGTATTAEFDGMVDDFDAALRVGAKVLEMAERVTVAHAALPGSRAVWDFEIDDRRFTVVVTCAATADGPREPQAA